MRGAVARSKSVINIHQLKLVDCFNAIFCAIHRNDTGSTLHNLSSPVEIQLLQGARKWIKVDKP